MFSRVSSLWKNPSRGRSLELFPFPNLAMKKSPLKTMMIGRRSGFLLGPGAFSGAMRLCMLNFQGVLARVWYLSLAGCEEQRVALTGWSRFPSFHDEPIGRKKRWGLSHHPFALVFGPPAVPKTHQTHGWLRMLPDYNCAYLPESWFEPGPGGESNYSDPLTQKVAFWKGNPPYFREI